MKKSLSLIAAGVMTVGLVMGSFVNSVGAASNSNSIISAGSTALQPLVDQAAQMYMAKDSDASIQVQGGGSGTGLKNVAAGVIDIGNSDVAAEDKLSAADAKKLVDHKVCVVGFAAVVNSQVKVKNLSSKQLIGIFTGKIKNWKEVGGNNLPIVVINRPTSSGTRAVFKKYALKNNDEAQGLALTEDSSGAVEKTIAQTKGSIGYLAMPYIYSAKKLSVKPISLDNVEPTNQNIINGKYSVWSYEHMYTNGKETGLTKKFLEFMASKEVKVKVVNALKYIPTQDMKVKR